MSKSVFAMGPQSNLDFRDEARLSGRIGKILASAWSVSLVFDQIGSGWSWGSALFPYRMRGKHKACLMMILISGSDRLHCTPVECHHAEFNFRVTSVVLVSLSCRLQFADRDVIFSVGAFLRVLGVICHPKMVDCLFKSYLPNVVMDVVTESISFFSRNA